MKLVEGFLAKVKKEETLKDVVFNAFDSYKTKQTMFGLTQKLENEPEFPRADELKLKSKSNDEMTMIKVTMPREFFFTEIKNNLENELNSVIKRNNLSCSVQLNACKTKENIFFATFFEK